jgi:hypothetical protein
MPVAGQNQPVLMRGATVQGPGLPQKIYSKHGPQDTLRPNVAKKGQAEGDQAQPKVKRQLKTGHPQESSETDTALMSAPVGVAQSGHDNGTTHDPQAIEGNVRPINH